MLKDHALEACSPTPRHGRIDVLAVLARAGCLGPDMTLGSLEYIPCLPWGQRGLRDRQKTLIRVLERR